MTLYRPLVLATLVLSGLAALACAPRTTPSRFPNASAASPDATAAAPAPVTRSLDADPPLPGEETAGWAGLAPTGDAEADPHGGHRGHGGAGAQDGTAP